VVRKHVPHQEYHFKGLGGRGVHHVDINKPMWPWIEEEEDKMWAEVDLDEDLIMEGLLAQPKEDLDRMLETLAPWQTVRTLAELCGNEHAPSVITAFAHLASAIALAYSLNVKISDGRIVTKLPRAELVDVLAAKIRSDRLLANMKEEQKAQQAESIKKLKAAVRKDMFSDSPVDAVIPTHGPVENVDEDDRF